MNHTRKNPFALPCALLGTGRNFKPVAQSIADPLASASYHLDYRD